MLFNIEQSDPWISGWLTPDNPGAEPAVIVVREGGRRRDRVPALDYRADVHGYGFHETGMCGFTLREENCPGLRSDEDLELYEADSNLLLFRRAPADAVAIRHFHLETQTLPVYAFAQHLTPLIRMIFSSAELIGEETLYTLLNLKYGSLFVAGAFSYRSYEAVLTRQEFRRSTLLSSPYRELAGRLLRAKSLAGAFEGEGEGWRGLGQAGLIAAFADVDLTDSGQLARGLKSLSDEDFFALANPTVRKLAVKSAADALGPQHVGQALDSLADFDLVGFDDDLDGFLDGLEALFGRTGLPRTPADQPRELAEAAEALAHCRPARELIVLDAHLAELAREAISKAELGSTAAAL